MEVQLSRRIRGAALLAAAIAVPATVAVFLSADAGAHASANRTLTVFEARQGSTFGFVDSPPKTTRKDPHASVGDVLVFSSLVFDESRTHRLGLSSGACTTARPGRIARATYTCTGTFALKDGTLAVAGLQKGEPKTLLLAVTGGTGAYEGARGTLVARMLKSGTEDTITLLP